VNDFDLVRKNLFRRKLRAILMIVSILIAFMIFGVLAGFYRAFTAGEDRAAADRLITVNKINFTQPLPIAYFNRVRALEGAADPPTGSADWTRRISDKLAIEP
jgi:putative ABC transport system permease protein